MTAPDNPLFAFDRRYRGQGYDVIAGIDEAGRGPWAGPVVAAAVIFPCDCCIPDLNDSKKISPLKRDKLFDIITARALAVGVGVVGSDVIDAVNILNATYKAMRTAYDGLIRKPDFLLIDGLPVVGLPGPQAAVVQGDGLSASIAAASIIAKVTRDRIMLDLAARYPGYGFERHKGYGTRDHLAALQCHGPCAVHRFSFAPVKECGDARQRR